MDTKELLLKFTNKCESIHPGNSGVKHSVDKLWQKYKNADPEYINTHFFRRLLTKKFKLIDKSPIFALKIITEELAANKTPNFVNNINESSSTVQRDEDSRKIGLVNQLNDALKKLSKLIKKIDETEVGSSDDGQENQYVKVDRYKRRFNKIYEKLCEIKGITAQKKLNFQGTKYPQLNAAISNYYNANRECPDFKDVLHSFEIANKSLNLNLSQTNLKQTAEEAFKKLGDQLQNRRNTDISELMNYYLSDDDEVPASVDGQLEEKLKQNDLCKRREEDVLEKFSELQRRMENANNHGEDNEMNSAVVVSDNNGNQDCTNVNVPKLVDEPITSLLNGTSEHDASDNKVNEAVVNDNHQDCASDNVVEFVDEPKKKNLKRRIKPRKLSTAHEDVPIIYVLDDDDGNLNVEVQDCASDDVVEFVDEPPKKKKLLQRRIKPRKLSTVHEDVPVISLLDDDSDDGNLNVEVGPSYESSTGANNSARRKPTNISRPTKDKISKLADVKLIQSRFPEISIFPVTN